MNLYLQKLTEKTSAQQIIGKKNDVSKIVYTSKHSGKVSIRGKKNDVSKIVYTSKHSGKVSINHQRTLLCPNTQAIPYMKTELEVHKIQNDKNKSVKKACPTHFDHSCDLFRGDY